jgi:hypothetical protein
VGIGTQEVVLEGERRQADQFPLDVVAVVLRLVVLLVLQLHLELQLAIDAGEQALTHIVYNQRIYVPFAGYRAES